jgi:hypothetical protein
MGNEDGSMARAAEKFDDASTEFISRLFLKMIKMWATQRVRLSRLMKPPTTLVVLIGGVSVSLRTSYASRKTL